jgi:MSHA biogenesis protein MshN
MSDVLREVAERDGGQPVGARRTAARPPRRRSRRRAALAALAGIAAGVGLSLLNQPPAETERWGDARAHGTAAVSAGLRERVEEGRAAAAPEVRQPEATPQVGQAAPDPVSVPAEPAIATPGPAAAAAPAEFEDAAGLEREAAPELRPPSFERVPSRQIADSSYLEALRLQRGGRAPEAIEKLREALALDADHVRARERLARLLTADGRLGAAIRVLREGRERDPSRSDLARFEARLLLEGGLIDEAITVLESALPEGHIAPEHQAFLAALLQQRGDHVRASELYRVSVLEDASHAAWWLGLAISLDAQSKGDEALPAFRRALALGGLNPAARSYTAERVHSLEGSAP